MPPHLPPTEAQPADSTADEAIDAWLRRDLHQRHALLPTEPIPAALLQIIDAAFTRDGVAIHAGSQGRPVSGNAPDTAGAFDRRVRERAYYLWLEEGCPEDRALEHWMLAFVQQVAQEASDEQASDEQLDGDAFPYSGSSPAGASAGQAVNRPLQWGVRERALGAIAHRTRRLLGMDIAGW